MTDLNTSPVEGTLFARKGEAMPSGGRAPGSGAPLTMFSGSSPLSFLIQRQCTPAKEAPKVENNDAASAASPLGQVAGSAAALEEYPTRPVVNDDEPQAAQPLPPRQLRRVSCRIDADQHRRLKNLAGLWGVSCQSLYQKAVDLFLEDTVIKSDSSWRN